MCMYGICTCIYNAQCTCNKQKSKATNTTKSSSVVQTCLCSPPDCVWNAQTLYHHTFAHTTSSSWYVMNDLRALAVLQINHNRFSIQMTPNQNWNLAHELTSTAQNEIIKYHLPVNNIIYHHCIYSNSVLVYLH